MGDEDYPCAEIEQTSRMEYEITIRTGPDPRNRWGPCYIGGEPASFCRLAINRRHAEWKARRLLREYQRWEQRKTSKWRVRVEG